MIVVDTSVWSLALRRKGPESHSAVDFLQETLRSGREIGLPGIVLQEALQAFRDDVTFERHRRFFRAFRLLDPERADFERAATLHRTCAAAGIATTTPDCLIAALTIAAGARLLTTDRDFYRIAEVAPLSLVAFGG